VRAVHKLEFISNGHYYKFYFDDMEALMDYIEDNDIEIPDYILMGEGE